MGLITQVVSAIVDTVEQATGNENSDAGNWVEEQAANVEGAAEDAAETVADVASDPVGFLAAVVAGTQRGATEFGQNVGTHLRDGVGRWLFGNLDSAGIQAPSRLDLISIVTFVNEVLGVTAGRVEDRVTRYIGDKPVGVAKEIGGAVTGLITDGPASFWGDVKDIVTDTAKREEETVRRWAAKMGVAIGSSPPAQVIEQIAREGSEHPSVVWAKIKRAIRDGQGRAACGLQLVACRADEEFQRVVTDVRHASTLVSASAVPVSQHFPRANSRTAEGMELRRISGKLIAAPVLGSQAGRHTAAAINSAVRAALLEVELLLWLSMIRRVARRMRVVSARRVKLPPPRVARAF